MSVDERIDWRSALREYLLAQTTLTNQVGTDVYVSYIPKGVDDPDTPNDIVVIQTGGGSKDQILPVMAPDALLRCYSDDAHGAWLVYRKVAEVLDGAENQKIDIGTGVGSGDNWMVTAREVTLPDEGRERIRGGTS